MMHGENLKENIGKYQGGDRVTTEELYRTECHIIAYLRYYFFLNYPVIRWILQKNLENGIAIIPGNKVVKILDFGAGPGTASMAISDFLEDARGIGIYENVKIKLYCVLEKIEGQGGFADPSELREYRRDEEIKLRGWVIKRTSTERAENITLCSGLGRCNLAFWREREVFEQVGGVSEGDILWIEGDYSGSSFNDLHSVYVSRVIEHWAGAKSKRGAIRRLYGIHYRHLLNNLMLSLDSNQFLPVTCYRKHAVRRSGNFILYFLIQHQSLPVLELPLFCFHTHQL